MTPYDYVRFHFAKCSEAICKLKFSPDTQPVRIEKTIVFYSDTAGEALVVKKQQKVVKELCPAHPNWGRYAGLKKQAARWHRLLPLAKRHAAGLIVLESLNTSEGEELRSILKRITENKVHFTKAAKIEAARELWNDLEQMKNDLERIEAKRTTLRRELELVAEFSN